MNFKTPEWWYKRNAAGAPWWRFLLWPISRLWVAVNHAKGKRTSPYRSRLHVISVGNLTVGGSGKTPLTREILRLLTTNGHIASGLSKGYGGTLYGPINIDSKLHSTSDVGDEAYMLGREFPFMVAKDRAAGLRALENTGTQIVVVDDAHQNLKIAKNINIVVVDGDTSNRAWPFGDGSVVPMGPMREPLEEGLGRASLIILWLPSETASADPDLLKAFGDTPVHIARLIVEPHPVQKLIALAAIAKPWKFRDTLISQGHEVVALHAFPDHAPIDEARLRGLQAEAVAKDAILITTEKDWVKLPKYWQSIIDYLPIRAQFDDEAAILRALTPANLTKS